MTERTLGPTGVGSDYDKKLSADMKKYFKDMLASNKFSEATLAAFFDELDVATSMYFSSREISLSSAPPKVRDNLTAGMNVAKRLIKALEKLDGNSKLLIDEVAQNTALDTLTHARSLLDTLEVDLDKIKQSTFLDMLVQTYSTLGTLELALDEASKLPRKKFGPDYAKQNLALAVRRAIEYHLGIPAKTTKNGVFDNVLAAILGHIKAEKQSGDADAPEEPDVHKLTRQAVKGEIVEHEGGALEFIPASNVEAYKNDH